MIFSSNLYPDIKPGGNLATFQYVPSPTWVARFFRFSSKTKTNSDQKFSQTVGDILII